MKIILFLKAQTKILKTPQATCHWTCLITCKKKRKLRELLSGLMSAWWSELQYAKYSLLTSLAVQSYIKYHINNEGFFYNFY